MNHFKKLLSLAWIVCFSFTSTAWASFDDTGDSIYADAIDYLELQGVVRNSDQFRPNDPLTRAELATMLSRILLIPDEDHGFNLKDVPDGAWFEHPAEWAVEKGWMTTENGEFQPEKLVSKVDALKILLKAYGHGARVVNAENRIRLFKDVSITHPEYEWLSAADQLGVIQHHQAELFQPYKKVTRAEWAHFLYNMEYYDLLGQGNNYFYNSDILADIWTLVEHNFYSVNGDEISEEALFQGAVKGILEVLNDPYTVYFDPEAGDSFLNALNGKVFGVGMVLGASTENGIPIESVLDDSPAQAEGIQKGDILIKVDGVSTLNQEPETVASWIRGEKGTSVKLTFIRNESNFEVTLVRAEVQNKAVKTEVEQGLWIIHLSMFSETSDEELTAALQTLKTEELQPKGLILDLRENRGGYLQSAEGIASHFLKRDAVIYQLKTANLKIPVTNPQSPDFPELPMIIWINENSASASEVITAAFQDWDRATVVGQQSFGKGTAQSIKQFWDGSILKITVAEWLSPKGNSIQKVGITPDIAISKEAEESEWIQTSLDAIQ